MVADAEGEIVEARTVVRNDEPEDHPEATYRRRKVDLSAPCSFGGIATSRRRPRHVLSKGLGIEASREIRWRHHGRRSDP